MRSLLIFVFLFNILNITFGQDLKIGEWTSYLPYHNAQWVTQSDDAIFFATPYSIIKIGKTDNSVNFISKEKGLSDVSIASIAYNKEYQYLIIAYQNSNIDLIKSNGDVININSIVSNNNIITGKKINSIHVSDQAVFFSCDFGLVELDLENLEFGFTCFTSKSVNSFTVFHGNYYMATEDGIFRAPVSNSFNYQNFQSWEKMGETNGFPSTYNTQVIGSTTDSLYLNLGQAMYTFDGTDMLNLSYYEAGYQPTFFSHENNITNLGFTCVNNCDGKVLYKKNNANTWTNLPANCINRPNYAIADENESIWFADNWEPFRKLNTLSDAECQRFDYNSPNTINMNGLAVKDGKVWTVPGGISIFNGASFNTEGINLFENNTWSKINRFTHPILYDSSAHLDFQVITTHPSNGKVYIGSYFGGLIEWENNSINVYNEFNSSLLPALGDVNTCRVSGLAFDKDQNLWIGNSLGAISSINRRPISVFTKAGTWQNFSLPESITQSSYLYQTAIDRNNNKWFVLGGANPGLLVFNENGTLDDDSDDIYRLINSSNSSLPSNNVNAVAVDLDGDVWVGTSDGAVVFECGGSVFDEECKGSRRIVVVEGIPAFLLEGESVKCIAIDGANRKWFGSTNGVFVISADGNSFVANYKTENSPLLDNTVNSIAIDEQTGVAYMGTAKGLCAFRNEATSGGIVNNTAEAFAYPNPVEPDYTGPIAIKGLARDANIKITDVAGRLVFETEALGGQAIWYGKDYLGNNVKSGVYLVFSTGVRNSENPDGLITKIVVVR